MPSSVASVFAAAGLERDGVVPWGRVAGDDRSGVYVVALTEELDSLDGALPSAPIAATAVEELLRVRPELTLDARRPSADELAARIAGFWLPDETILYIGLATTLRSRVRGFYTTPIGARRPHSGGWFLKTLANLNDLYVHFARTPDFVAAETAILAAFVGAVAPQTHAGLADPEHPWPFANLEIRRDGRKIRKRHGIQGARGDLPPPHKRTRDDKGQKNGPPCKGEAGQVARRSRRAVEELRHHASPRSRYRSRSANASISWPRNGRRRAPLHRARRGSERRCSRAGARRVAGP